MPKNNKISFTLLLLILMAGVLIFLVLQNKTLKSRSGELQSYIQKQDRRIDSLSRMGMAGMIGSILDKVEDELNASPARMLSEERIASIVSLCYFFKPYAKYIDGRISEKALSPERGQVVVIGRLIDKNYKSLDAFSIDTSSPETAKTYYSAGPLDLFLTNNKTTGMHGDFLVSGLKT